MKKLPWVIILVLLGVIAWFAFGGKKDSPVEEIPGTPIAPVVDKTPESSGPIFAGEEGKSIVEESQYMKVDAQYPAFTNASVSKLAKEFVQNQLAQFKADANLEALSQADKDFVFQNGSKYEFDTTYKIYQSDQVSTIVFSIATYTGGAHGGLVLRSLNVTPDGRLITIGDLFTSGSNYLTKLSELSRTKLKASLKDNAGEWFEDGITPISQNFETFYITDGNTLHIIFQPYQVGPWVAGAPEITIDIQTELQGIINEDI